MPANMGWLETITVAITKKEPKTPMSFYTRLLWIIAAMILGPLYAPIDATYKPIFLGVGIVMALGLSVWVSYFAWTKPKHLLYAAESHIEEFKIEAKGGELTPEGLATSGGVSEPRVR
jgi:hypothetical protein